MRSSQRFLQAATFFLLSVLSFLSCHATLLPSAVCTLRTAIARSSLGLALLTSPYPQQLSAAAEAPSSTNYILRKEYLADGVDLRRKGVDDKMTTRSMVIRASEKVLTNKVLENFRKADQLERDEAMLLDGGNNLQQTSKVLLLLPIIEIQEDLRATRSNINAIRTDNDEDSVGRRGRARVRVDRALAIIGNNKYDSKNFKKVFNRYSDNILYTNVAEANIYLAGGTTPNSLQTEQYLYRNAALTSVQFIREDLVGLQAALGAEASSSDEGDRALGQQIDDCLDDCDESLSALESYLSRADPQDFRQAVEVYEAKKGGPARGK